MSATEITALMASSCHPKTLDCFFSASTAPICTTSLKCGGSNQCFPRAGPTSLRKSVHAAATPPTSISSHISYSATVGFNPGSAKAAISPPNVYSFRNGFSAFMFMAHTTLALCRACVVRKFVIMP